MIKKERTELEKIIKDFIGEYEEKGMSYTKKTNYLLTLLWKPRYTSHNYGKGMGDKMGPER